MGCGSIPRRVKPEPEDDGTPLLVDSLESGLDKGQGQDVASFKVEERAILLVQLKDLMSTIEVRLSQQPELLSTGSPTRLLTSSCNLYDTVHHFIKPATMQQKCSYVELVAEGPQLAQWFVSHWWGEPVIQFIACVEKHSHHRKLTEKVPYWVCAYANNQWQLGDELGTDPSSSSFRRALDVSTGTLSILDDCAKVYSRIWCDYEVYVTLDKGTWTTHLYDIYTWKQGEVLGLTDGVAAIDQRGASWWWEDKKHQREKHFPLELVKAAMQIQVQYGEASVEEDRRRILHAICGTDPMEEPPLEHPRYEAVNATLQARFALSSWVLALEHGAGVESYTRALSASHITRISLSFRSKNYVTDAMLISLASALPRTLKELCLVTTRCKKLSDEGVLALASAIESLSLEHLHLDLAHNFMTDASMEALSPKLPRSLRHLWLSIGMCPNVTDVSTQHLGAAFPRLSRLEHFFVSLVACPKLTGRTLCCLGPAVGAATNLRSYSLLLGSVNLEDQDVLVALENLPQGLEEFFLDCWACKRLSPKVLLALQEKLSSSMPRLRLLDLTFGEIPAISGEHGRSYAQRQPSAVPEMLGREELEIRFYT